MSTARPIVLPWGVAYLLRSGLILLFFNLSACTVGPDYDGPPRDQWASFHNTKKIAAKKPDTPPPPLETWWTGFKDARLNEIIQAAINQNLDLKASQARVQQSRAIARHAAANLLPTAGVVAGALPIYQSLESPIGALGRAFPGFKRGVTLYEAGLGAIWEIDLAGGLRRGRESAIAQAQAAEAQHLGTRIMIAADAADAWLQIRGYQKRLKLTQAQIKTSNKLLQLVKLRRQHGMATDMDMAQTEALLANTLSNVPPLRIALETQQHRLEILLGSQPGTWAATLAPASGKWQIPPVYVDSNVSDLLRRRPDIIAAERKLQATSAGIGMAVSEYYPKVSLLGLTGFQSMRLGHLFRQATFEPAALGGLYWRLFDFGKIDAEVCLTKGVHAEALIQYRQSILRATEEVENAFMTLAQYQIQAKALTAQKNALARTLRLSQFDYRHGNISLVNVLQAERDLLAVRDHLAQTNTNIARAAVSTFRALGGGW